MTCTIAIINWNSGLLLRSCIESLLATTTTAEIVVIDNASEDDSVESVQGFRTRVHFVRNSVNRGFAAAVNQAFQVTSSSYVLILNPDVRAMPGAVQLLEDFMNANPRAAAVGGYVGDKYLPKGLPTVKALVRENLGFSPKSPWQNLKSSKTDHESEGLNSSLRRFHASLPRVAPEARKPGGLRSEASHEGGVGRATGAPYSGKAETPFFSAPMSPVPVDQPAAAAIMIRRDAYDDVDGFDEQFYPAWYEDVDFCERVKAKGWDIYFAAHAEFLHEGGYSAEAMGPHSFLASYYGNQVRYARKHFGSLGSAAVRASIALGMLGRMIGRPKQAAAYGKALMGALKGW